MNAIILAAGYATRLYPLTLNKAKPLLKVGRRPIIEWTVENLTSIPEIETIYIVANDKFTADFQIWANTYQEQRPKCKLRIVNDGSTSDEDKLGAIGDINFIVTRENLTAGNLLIVAGDNLLTESLRDFVEYAKKTEATVAVYDVGDRQAIKKYGNIDIDADGMIIHFEEKPEKPRSTLAAVALYYYSAEIISLLRTYLAAGNNPDQPGRFVQWLYTRKPIKTFQLRGKWLDIGSKETLENADKILGGGLPRRNLGEGGSF